MVGREHGALPLRHLLAGEPAIARNFRRLADQRDRAGAVERPVAVDHEARIALRDQMHVHFTGKPGRDLGNADVPCDVPLQFAGMDAEIAERAGDQAAIMIAGEEERRAAAGIFLKDRRNFVVLKES